MGVHADLDGLLADLRARGARVTTARRAVLAELVRRGSAHPSAEQIAARLRRSRPEVHLSTVYRTLDVLEELGLVARAGITDGVTTYHLAADRHHHAVCQVCGTVIELPESALSAVVARLRRDHGFAADPHHLTIPGVCARCRG
jgi:Fur family transcriptional regulator, ferric uptake regulator